MQVTLLGQAVCCVLIAINGYLQDVSRGLRLLGLLELLEQILRELSAPLMPVKSPVFVPVFQSGVVLFLRRCTLFLGGFVGVSVGGGCCFEQGDLRGVGLPVGINQLLGCRFTVCFRLLNHMGVDCVLKSAHRARERCLRG